MYSLTPDDVGKQFVCANGSISTITGIDDSQSDDGYPFDCTREDGETDSYTRNGTVYQSQSHEFDIRRLATPADIIARADKRLRALDAAEPTREYVNPDTLPVVVDSPIADAFWENTAKEIRENHSNEVHPLPMFITKNDEIESNEGHVQFATNGLRQNVLRSLPQNPTGRKTIPIMTGVVDYFPLAMAEIARVSKAGNDQHNPGKPLHWNRGVSSDHADCVLRHLVERGTIDTDGQRHMAKAAWRALALLQEELELAAGWTPGTNA